MTIGSCLIWTGIGVALAMIIRALLERWVDSHFKVDHDLTKPIIRKR